MLSRINIIIMPLIMAIFMLAGCSGGGGSGGGSADASTVTSSISVNSSAQKGPFVKGSLVTAYKLVNGVRTHETKTTSTDDNRGHFLFFVDWSGPTEIEIVGNYLNENNGEIVANGRLTVVLETEVDKLIQNININIFTHIATPRIKEMLQNSSSLQAAIADATNRIKEMFGLELLGDSGLESLNLTKGSGEHQADNAKLLQISAALLTSKNPDNVLEQIAQDLKDGDLNQEGLAFVKDLKEKTAQVDMEQVAFILETKLNLRSSTAPRAESLAGELPLNHNLKITPLVDVELNAQLDTDIFVISGVLGNATVHVTNGSCYINGSRIEAGDTGSIQNGDRFFIKQFAASSYATTNITRVYIGGTSLIFKTTTKSNPALTDTTPNDFYFNAKVDVNLSSSVYSDAIVVSGLSELTETDINISNGSYQINGALLHSPSTVVNGDIIKVFKRASHKPSKRVVATLSIGGVSADFVVLTRPRDTIPNEFSFDSKYNVVTNTTFETPYILTGGYEGTLDLQVENGEVQLEGETLWASSMKFVPTGYRIKFRFTSSPEYNTEVKTTIQFGQYLTSFTTLTQINPSLMDSAPNEITFPTKVISVPEGGTTEVISDEMIISGIDAGVGARIVCSGYAYLKVNDGAWTNQFINVKPGDRVRLKADLSLRDTPHNIQIFYDREDSYNKDFAYFRVYTRGLKSDPDPIVFTPLNDVVSSHVYESPYLTISGIESNVTISAKVVGLHGSVHYSINGHTSQNPGELSLKNGDTISLSIYSSGSEGKTRSATLLFANQAATFSVTTNVRPVFRNQAPTEINPGIVYNFEPDVRDTQNVTFSIEHKPTWISLDSATGVLSGTPTHSDTFIASNVVLIATDTGGLSTSLSLKTANKAPVLTSSLFRTEVIVDDKSKNPHGYTLSFQISDVDTDISDLRFTLENNITERRVGYGLSQGFSNSGIICDNDGKCGATINLKFESINGIHPSLKTRHTITLSDGENNVSNYIDIWYAPTTPLLRVKKFTNITPKDQSIYNSFSYTASNIGNKAELWSIVNKPEWAIFDATIGRLYGTPLLGQHGTYSDIQIIATNDRGSYTRVLQIIVEEMPKFVFTDAIGVEIQKWFDSTITVDWLENGTTVAISSSGYIGQSDHTGFRVNGLNNVTQVQNGDRVTVWHKSSNSYNTTLNTTITIGENSDTFSTKTKASLSTKLPLITGAPGMRAHVNELYSYTPQLSTDYTRFAPATKLFTVVNKPAWASFDTVTGTLSGTPTTVGEEKNVKITAFGDNGLDDITFNITISHDGPYINGYGHSLENDDLNFTFNDNSDWRSKITQVELRSCYPPTISTVLAADDYTFSEGSLKLHVSNSLNVALHIPTMGGGQITVKSTGYGDSSTTVDYILNGQYGVKATASTNVNNTLLTEGNLNGAKIDITLSNYLKFEDSTLDTSNFNLYNAPDGTTVSDVTYISEDRATLTLAFNGTDFDENRVVKIAISDTELNSCQEVVTNEVNVEAFVEIPWSNIIYPSEVGENERFGFDVDVSNETVAVASSSGVSIFEKNATGVYIEIQKIVQKAESIALYGDYLVIGNGSYTHSLDSDARIKSLAGQALVYKKDTTGEYVKIADITPSIVAHFDHFGSAVDMSDDLIVVGASNADYHKGLVYLFQNDGYDNFTLVQTISRENGKSADYFGYSVAIDGDYFVIGTNMMSDLESDPIDSKSELGAGLVHYYSYMNDDLELIKVIKANDSTTMADHFGVSVAISGDHIAVGSPGNNNKGSVYIYRREFTTASFISKIEGEIENESFGRSVGIYHFASNYLAIGTIKGNAYKFTQNGSAYIKESFTQNGDDLLGYSVAIDKNDLIFGMYKNSEKASQNGAALVVNAIETIRSSDDGIAYQFRFTDVLNTELSSIQKDSIFVSGITKAVPISITGGEYSFDGVTWISTEGSVENNQRVYVRHTSSAGNATEVQTRLYVGDISDIFSSTTKPLNNRPVANAQDVAIKRNSVNNIITLFATDRENDGLTYSVVSQPLHGVLSGTAPNMTYSPTLSYIGSDSFTFKATDSELDSKIVNVNLDINKVVHNAIAYGVVISPYTQQSWLDRNIGASKSCSASNDSKCYGLYYQWGRQSDGHEKLSSYSAGFYSRDMQATDINDTGVDYIASSTDWVKDVDADGVLRMQNWEKTNGESICPIGYRVPTLNELLAETINSVDAMNTYHAAFASFLKLPAAGYRSNSGSGIYTGSTKLWSSNVSLTKAKSLYFYSGNSGVSDKNRADGYSVRCIKQVYSKIKKTGQTKSYDENGTVVLDGSIKDDGYYQSGVTPKYTRINSIVIDEVTQLMWQDSEHGYASWLSSDNYDTCAADLSSPACFDTSGDTATTYCTNLMLENYTDWRLPTIDELRSIVDYGMHALSIDTSIFTHIDPFKNDYWSVSPVKNDYWEVSRYSYVIDYHHGNDKVLGKATQQSVMCVRSIQ